MLEKVKHEDAEELFALTKKNRHYLREWLPWLDGIRTVTDTQEFITNSIILNETGLGIVYTLRESNNIVGMCGFNKLDHDKKVAI